jgi:hypothetical protein
MPGTIARLRRKVFERHANPLSAWSRWGTTPLILVPVWTRKWTHAVPVLAWMIANAVVFPKPEHERAWATRAVLGEEMWIVERPRGRRTSAETRARQLGDLAGSGGSDEPRA